MRLLTLILAASTLSACALSGRSIRDVPRVDATKITVPAMSALPNRDVALSIVDARRPEVRENSLQIQDELQRATQQALTDAGINVTAASNNSLTLTIQDYQTQKFQDGCVKITGSLVLPQQAKLGSDASSCYETKTPGGRKISANITQAYEEALSLVFKNLDEAMGKLQTIKK